MPVRIIDTITPYGDFPVVNFVNVGGTHHDGVGKPTTAPTRAGLMSADNEGKIYVSGDEIVQIATHPTITTHAIGPGGNEWELWRGIAGLDSQLSSDGYFGWSNHSEGF